MLVRFLDRRFGLKAHGTTVRRELMAGLVSFVTSVYIIIVNSAILADAGIPVQAGMIATIATSFVGCWLIGWWSNTPLVIVPGMGINALFTYTVVHTMGLSWQEALAAVFVSGFLFCLVAFTGLAGRISQSVPHTLKEAIGVGIGLFLTFIGLQKSGIVVPSASTFIALGDLGSPEALVTLLTLALMAVLYVRGVNGSFLIAIVFGTAVAWLLGLINPAAEGPGFGLRDAAAVFGALSFGGLWSLPFWIAAFSMAMVIVFENLGLIHSQTASFGRPDTYRRAFQAAAVSNAAAGLLGSSPTVSAVEGSAGIASGGRTGLTAVFTGVLFLGSYFAVPLLQAIPDSAIAPVLIILGSLMLGSIKAIPFEDFSEAFPAFLVIAMIPLTYSIVDGIAFGFIAYPVVKLAAGKGRQVSATLYVIALLFLLYEILQVMNK
ncbi:NCS2 family permease [Paenibacillus chitinolyticus]|uniref:NCS2 family permease n=1 Tax=Paenibacillus chitinolyticus TaxID=79263 RepID=A0A410WVV0_9BACL|nr:NCS2 family permease [Paenibacillus chitinolyticus]